MRKENDRIVRERGGCLRKVDLLNTASCLLRPGLWCHSPPRKDSRKLLGWTVSPRLTHSICLTNVSHACLQPVLELLHASLHGPAPSVRQELSLLPVLTDPAACAAVTGAFLPGPVHQAWKSSSSHHISQHMVPVIPSFKVLGSLFLALWIHVLEIKTTQLMCNPLNVYNEIHVTVQIFLTQKTMGFAPTHIAE